uniref:Uncharacterized protein n=1 Tax=Acrobeloides nanus TaxID=290746 RepID=A0A914CV95_9BILA
MEPEKSRDVPSVEELHLLLEKQDEVIFELSKQLEDTRLELQEILSTQKVSSSDEEIVKSKQHLIDAHLLVEIKEKLTELSDVLLQLKEKSNVQKLDKPTKEIDIQNSSVLTMHYQLMEKQNELDSSKRELATTQAKLETSDGEISRLNSEVHSLRDVISSNQMKFSTKIDDLMKNFTEKSVELEQFKSENHSLEAKFHELQELFKHKELILENQYSKLQKDVLMLRSEKVVMQERIKEMLNENHDLKNKLIANSHVQTLENHGFEDFSQLVSEQRETIHGLRQENLLLNEKLSELHQNFKAKIQQMKDRNKELEDRIDKFLLKL